MTQCILFIGCMDNVQVDICYDYAYFEVFGLTDDEFGDIANFYYDLIEQESK